MQWDDLTNLREERTNAEIYSRAQAEVNFFPAQYRVCPRTGGTEMEKEDSLLELSYGICNGSSDS
jgi:hypothetical protein